MPKLTMTVPHRLTRDEALRRIQNLAADAKARYGDQVTDVEESWNGYDGAFSGKGMGMKVSGRVSVRPTEVAIDADLPLMAAAFKGQIEQRVRQQAEALLA